MRVQLMHLRDAREAKLKYEDTRERNFLESWKTLFPVFTGTSDPRQQN